MLLHPQKTSIKQPPFYSHKCLGQEFKEDVGEGAFSAPQYLESQMRGLDRVGWAWLEQLGAEAAGVGESASKRTLQSSGAWTEMARPLRVLGPFTPWWHLQTESSREWERSSEVSTNLDSRVICYHFIACSCYRWISAPSLDLEGGELDLASWWGSGRVTYQKCMWDGKHCDRFWKIQPKSAKT